MYTPPWAFPKSVNDAVEADWCLLGTDFRTAAHLISSGKPASAFGVVARGVVRLFIGAEPGKTGPDNQPK